MVLSVTCSLSSVPIAAAASSKEAWPDLPLNSEWSEPVFSQYTPINNKISEWRYTRKNATLIITRSECEKCKPVTQHTVDEYNSREVQSTGRSRALLLDLKGIPAMFRLSTSRKNVNFRVFEIYTNGFYYKIQLGVNSSAPQAFSFMLDNEFMEMINGFMP